MPNSYFILSVLALIAITWVLGTACFLDIKNQDIKKGWRGSLSLMARDCAEALEAALEKSGGNDEALLEFASAVLTTLRHEMHTAARVQYPDYLMDWSRKVVAEVNERYKDDGRSDGVYVGRFSSVKGSAVVSGRIFLTNGSSIAGVVLASERDVMIIRGEFIDEPMNMWGYPKGIVIREGDGFINTLEALGDTDRGAVLPYYGVNYWRCAKTPQEIAKIYGIELEFHDTGNGTWASSFEKDIEEAPRKIHVSPVTGIEYFEPASKEETEEYDTKMNKKAESMRESLEEEREARRSTEQNVKRLLWHAEHPYGLGTDHK